MNNINIDTNMSPASKGKYLFKYSDYLLMIILGITILFLRSSHTITMPHLYTEDGVWMSELWNEGFWETILHAKGSYLVSGNIILLKISLIISQIIAGENLKYLPEIISFVSYLFYSSCAVFFVFTFKDIFNKFTLLTVWLLILLMPFGDHTYEILGRLSNSGFLFFLLSFCIICYRCYYDNVSKLVIAMMDFLLLICATTNPACYVPIGCFYLYIIIKKIIIIKPQIFKEFIKIFRTFEMISLLVTSTLLSLSVLYVCLSATRDLVSKEEFLWNKIVEFFARNLLYPFVFPFYNKLNDTLVITIFILIAFVCIATYHFLSSKKRFIFWVSFLSCMFMTILTLLSRSDIANILNEYTLTFPDRYFYINNIMFLIFIGFVFEPFFKIKEFKINTYIKCFYSFIICVFSLFMVCTYTKFAGYLFEYKTPRFGLPSETFVEKLKTSVIHNDVTESPWGKQCYLVQIESPGWSMWIPPEYAHATFLDIRKGTHNLLDRKFQVAEITDNNWELGINRNEPILLFDSSDSTVNLLSVAKQIKIDEHIIEIASSNIAEGGGYFYLHFNYGVDLSPFAYPAEFEVIR